MREKVSCGVLYLVFLLYNLFVSEFLQNIFIIFVIRGKKQEMSVTRKAA